MADRNYLTLRTSRGSVDVHKDFIRMFAHEIGTLADRRELFDSDMQYLMYLESQRPKLFTGWQPKKRTNG